MKTSLGRILAVTFGLSALGIVWGALLGGIGMLLDLGRHIPDADVVGVPGAFCLGASFGAIAGAILAPVVGWLFLRRASLGRAIAETALGVLAGILVGALWPSRPIYLLGLVGFLLAALRLWFATRHIGEHHAPAA
jgi:hypothetical protein